MAYVVLDLEWNIPSSKTPVNPAIVELIPQEIIQIGAQVLERHNELGPSFAAQVKPQFYPQLHNFIEKLTELEAEELSQAEKFPTQMQKFFNFLAELSSPQLICTWSESDTKPLLSNLEAHQLSWPLELRILDVQKLYAYTYEEASRQTSLINALEYLALPLEPERTLHQAVDDAYYTAKILQELISQLSSDGRLALDEEEAFLQLWNFSFNPYWNQALSYDLGGNFTPEDLPGLLSELDWQCPECQRSLEPQQWRQLKKGFRYQSFATCAEHGQVRLRLTGYYLPSKEQPPAPKDFQAKMQMRLLRPQTL